MPVLYRMAAKVKKSAQLKLESGRVKVEESHHR